MTAIPAAPQDGEFLSLFRQWDPGAPRSQPDLR
jgi:hypothetical protein